MPKLENRKSKLGWVLGALLAAVLLALALALPAPGQEAALYENAPALKFRGEVGDSTFVVQRPYRGENAFGFLVMHYHLGGCYGFLYLTKSRVAYDPVYSPDYQRDAFDSLRAEARQVIANSDRISVALHHRTYDFLPAIEVKGKRKFARSWEGWGYLPVVDFFKRALADFDAAQQEFQRLIAKAAESGGNAGGSPRGASGSPAATLQIEAQPGSSEFYVDDQFKGTTSSEGRLVVGELAPGEHRLRLARKGYQEWTRTVTLAAGETRTLEVQLAEAVPETALKLEDVLKLLDAGVTSARMETLVRERGVAFELTGEAEQKLRAAGATAELLLAIAKAKK
jgi:hypothetical protein